MVGVTDIGGNVVYRFEYSTYGEIFEVNSNNELDEFTDFEEIVYGFQGRRLDSETNRLMYFRNRYYNSILGRFLQRDPLGYLDSYGLYEAFGGNSYTHKDPMGLDVETTIMQDMANQEKIFGHEQKSLFRQEVLDDVIQASHEAVEMAEYATLFLGGAYGAVKVAKLLKNPKKFKRFWKKFWKKNKRNENEKEKYYIYVRANITSRVGVRFGDRTIRAGHSSIGTRTGNKGVYTEALDNVKLRKGIRGIKVVFKTEMSFFKDGGNSIELKVFRKEISKYQYLLAQVAQGYEVVHYQKAEHLNLGNGCFAHVKRVLTATGFVLPDHVDHTAALMRYLSSYEGKVRGWQSMRSVKSKNSITKSFKK